MSSIPFRSRRSLNTNQSVISNDSCAHDKNISSPSLINAKDSDGIMVQENPQKSNLLENNSSLFVKLLPSSVNPEKLAEEWIESYLSNSKNGTTDFIQLLISGSGCQAKISNNDLFSVSFDTILLNLAESFSSCVHPLVNGTKAYRYFNVNMKKFLYSVFEKIRHQVLSDGLFLSKLVNCLLPMCSSSIRPFRYTGTFVAMKLQSALLQMELSINQIINDLQVQCSGRLGLRSSSSASFCKDQINNQTKSIRIISKLEEELLIEVFDHRSRDVASNIRQLCLEELGHWLNINPQKFSQKKFIKYFVDFLHDKTNDTTLHCLRMLASLIDANNLDIVVSVFSTCKSRVHQLICDKDSSISSEIIRICSDMLRLGKDVVGESKFIHYCLFAYDSKRAYAAGQFFIVDLIRRATLLEIVRDDCNYLKLCTVRFFELGIQNHATYFIDSMFNYHSMFTNFDAMIDLLLCDNVWTDLSLLIDNIHEEELQLLLIHIITCSIHQAVTGNTPSGRTIQQSSQKNSKLTEDLRDQFTKAFTKHISEIMTTYLCEESKVVELLSLIPLMNVNEFQSYIEEHQFNIVIDKCKTLAERTINSEALSKVSAALEWLSNSHLKHCDNTNAVVNNVLDELTVEFNHYFKLMKTDDKDCNDENVRQSCAVALMKITIFNRNHAYMKYDFWRKLITLMKSNSNITILTYSIELSILRMFWMAHICTDTMNSTSIDENTINFCSKLLACSKQLSYGAICKLMCWLNAGLNGDRFAKIALFDISGQANSPVVKLMEFAENTILSEIVVYSSANKEYRNVWLTISIKSNADYVH
ncbi:hypothetical protein GJ496_002142 [Pomphorhynchus laevis]|nr:hypothetical protein GJ496_002142 [Pomphorhynchus laevis]